jgi:hypothetical protein
MSYAITLSYSDHQIDRVVRTSSKNTHLAKPQPEPWIFASNISVELIRRNEPRRTG